MNKIDTIQRKEFKIGNLFTQDRGKEKAPKQNKEGETWIVNEINTNNGLVRKVVPSKTFEKNGITISINYATNVFYQPKDFCASVNISILKNDKIGKYSGLFIVTLLRHINKQYNYTEKISKDKINETIIKLPVDKAGEPDWLYMENYIKSIERKCKNILKELKLIKNILKKDVNITSWKEFKVGDLFDIHPTKAYKDTNKDLFEKDGKNPVVVNSGFNNGIGGYTNKTCTESAGTITFTDTAAKSSESFFYQDKDFVGYPHVQGMYPKGHQWNKLESLFLTSSIKAAIKGRYDFIKKMTRDEILKLNIKLPVDSEGNPNRDFMENYIKNIESRCKINLNNLRSQTYL